MRGLTLEEKWAMDSDMGVSGFVSHSPQCHSCLHWMPDTGRLRCAAYPEGVPAQIAMGAHDHSSPFPGDMGITYKRAPAEVESERMLRYREALREESEEDPEA